MQTTLLQTAELGTTGSGITRAGFGAWAIGGGGWEFGWGAQQAEPDAPPDGRADLPASRGEAR